MYCTKVQAVAVSLIASLFPVIAHADNNTENPDVAVVLSEPPALKQGLRGIVLDKSTGLGLPAAVVQVLKGGIQTVATELDGTFVMPLEPGSYFINAFTPLYEQKQATVQIKRGQVTELTIELAPTEGAEEVIVIEDKIDLRSRSAGLAQRRASTAVSDTLSAHEISRTPDSSAGDAVKRVVSVSVLDNRYVVLRGLEGRYVTTLLNGVVLPSPEPDRNAVPLDLFPTSLLSNLTVYKSYSAELPGQFGGGTLMLETNSYPTDFDLKLGVTTGGSSAGTLQDGLVNASGGGVAEYLGYPSADRDLPDSLPYGGPLTRRNLDPATLEAVGETFPNVWTAGSETYTPNFGVSGVVGDTIKVAKRPLGYLATASFRRGLGLREGVNRRTAIDGNGDVYVTEDIATVQGKLESTVGGLVNIGYQLADKHSIQAFGLYTHIGEDLTYKATGYSESQDTDIDLTRLGFVARELGFAQLAGDHGLGDSGAKLAWQGNAAITRRDELDSRDIIYNDLPDGMTYDDRANSGQHYWSFLDDKSYGGGLDLTVPVSNLRLMAGVQAQASDRDFDGRRFRFRFIGSDPATLRLPAEVMLSPDHIGPDFLPEEMTLQEDAYRAGLSVLGGYTSAEATLAPELRVIGGVRYERSNQTLDNGTMYATGGVVLPEPIDRDESDVLPTGAVIFSPRTDTNVRFAYSRTLVRPKFREIAPFLYYDVIRRRNVSGTPDLATTRIENADVRWEWFLGTEEVLATSVFYKRFRDPIEQVIFNSGDDVAFRNAAAGDMSGVELEGKLWLGRFADLLTAFSVGGNFALIRSRVELSDADTMLQTSSERPLYGQSPYVVNLGLEYTSPKYVDLGLLYNVSGRRLVDIGIEGIPDTYEDAFHRVDVVATRAMGDFKIKGSVSNVLDRKIELSQDDVVVNEAIPGVAVSVGLEWIPK